MITAFEIGDKTTNYIASKNLFEPLVNLDKPVFDKFPGESNGLLYSGIGSIIDPENQFVFPILRAESTTISTTDLPVSDDIPS